jgi:2-polyprenyl-3-methyl-5-hydroxy-6-metoxy-1,4-benzoquinol methylase
VQYPFEESHLYHGFQFVGVLRSIRGQRRIQAAIIRGLRVERLLVIGCGYGDELAVLLGRLNLQDPFVRVNAIDLAPTGESVKSKDFARRLGSRFEFATLDLMDLAGLQGYGQFDVAQCGFVLHEIPYSLKEQALKILSASVRPRGHVIISDIFNSDTGSYTSEVAKIYDAFLREANCALSQGALQQHEWRSLLGDGSCPGLLLSKAEAVAGSRDYFETLACMVGRAARNGLDVCRIVSNPFNPWLYVIVTHRQQATTSHSVS